ncbi:MAG: hypothetical protein H7Z19_21850, partial [Chitinophagaceae bacterium]|nr:hypothetical protein [Rubrivivax sp.]
TAAIAALCRAEIAVFDLTGFDPGVLFLLGVRAVARRGVTLASVGGDYTVGGELPVPFNLQLLNLSAHSQRQQEGAQELRPAHLIGRKLYQGFRDLANLPHYLDLPTYDAVRQLGVDSGAYRPVRPSEKVLVLCPFSAEYSARNWRHYLDAKLPGKLRQSVLKTHPDARPRLERLLDVRTPRLVAQTLFEAIRLTDMCLIDWTDLRPNVMFEAGVRLAVNPLGAVHIVEVDDKGTRRLPAEPAAQVEGLLALFDPVGYCCKPGDAGAYSEMVRRFERQLEENRAGRVGFVYRAVGEALDRRAQPAALPLVDELLRQADILESDDEESTGISPILFHEVNKALVVEARAAAAERRLAAWLYLTQRWSASEIAADAHLRAQFDLLHAKVRPWARHAGRADLLEAMRLHQTAVRLAEPSTVGLK